MLLDLTKKPIVTYFLFGILYITEGIHIAVAWVLTPLYLLDLNIAPGLVTLFSGIIMIPWLGKFLYGYVVDSYSHNGRKSFIIYGGLLASLSLIFVSFINPQTSLISFIFLLFLGQIGIGFLDVSSDAWAIQLSKEHQRGKLTGAMTIGLYLGTFIGSSVLNPIADTIHFSIAYMFGGMFILPIIGMMFFIKETNIKTKKQFKLNPLLRQLTQKNLVLFLIFLSIISLNSGIISLAVPLYMDISLGLSVTVIGFIAGIFSLSRATGSFLFGTLSDTYGRKNTLIFIITATIIFSSVLVLATNEQIFMIIYTILGLLIGGLFSVLFALSMDKTKKGYLALQFGIFMAVINLGELSGGTISGTLITFLSFQQTFLYAAWVTGLGFLLLYLLKKETKTSIQ